ncbi:orotidine-5'-phosphate decarboxylase [Mesobacillus zeae]|uniref:Orotidine 5'-phosphate decarboxylase n=1 Tax=Mesobacillus zeae TaxID=1917180 RepID=A0A398BKK0_9BACI|nr:orotidine-5'-phosphate decarboxylase [Mesobacillus zeae]RID87936.1 orotidine-5'-phosphate decarboxylase [Mesobacillus zeae]
MNQSPIIALDFSGKKETMEFLDLFGNEELFVKIGMELFYKEGPSVISELKDRGHDVFLDLKLHDIPNTVKRAMKNLAQMGCDLVNVQAAGGSVMMEAALEGLEAGTPAGQTRPLCISVTQLTSTSEEQMQSEQLISASLGESVIHYARISQQAGLDGVVCSVQEAAMIASQIGTGFLTVCPGIRPAGAAAGDQKRVATPQQARESGVSSIVVGRPITTSATPFESYRLIKQEWEGGQA